MNGLSASKTSYDIRWLQAARQMSATIAQTYKKICFVREPDFATKKCPDNSFGKFSRLKVLRVKIRVFHA